MQRSFLVNLTFLLVLNLVVKPLYVFGIEAEVQNRVGADAYGEYFALISFSFILNIILDLGITNYNTRRVAQSPGVLTRELGRMFTLRLGLIVVYLGMLLLAGLSLSYSGEQLAMLGMLGFNQGLAALVLFLRGNLTGLHRFREDSIISVLDRALLICICATLLWGGFTGGDFYITWFIWAQTASYGIAVLVCLILLFKPMVQSKIKLDIPFSKDLIRKSMPFAVLIFLMHVYFRTDGVMLERIHPDGSTEAGIYAMGFRFFEAGNMFAYLFAILLLPIFSRLLSKNESVFQVLEQAFRLLYPGAVVVAAWCFVYREEIMDWRYIQHIEASSKVFAVLMIGFVGFAMNYIFGTLLTASGKLKSLNRLAVMAIVFNIAGNAILIPTYAAWGAAIVSMATQVLMAIGQIWLVHKRFEWRPGFGFLFSAVLFSIAVALLAWASAIISEYWLLNSGVFLLAAALVALAFGYLRPRRLLELIRSGKQDFPKAQ